MALALGLGSLFNHSESPNVSYTLNFLSESITYTTTRTVTEDEELCIFYGHKLWFQPAGQDNDGDETRHLSDCEVSDEWAGLSSIEVIASPLEPAAPNNPFSDGDPEEMIAESMLPFERFKLPPEEETPESIRTMLAWVVDIADPRHTSMMLKWLKQNKLDDELGHLKRVKKRGETSTMLLVAAASPNNVSDGSSLQVETLPLPTKIASLPQTLSLSAPYVVPVPSSVALTPISHQLKNALWPTVFAPKRKDVNDEWTRGKARWGWEAVQFLLKEAVKAKENGEVPIVAHVPSPYDSPTDLPMAFTSHDTRNSINHPLRHAVMNVIRQIADHRSSRSDSFPETSSDPSLVADNTSLPDSATNDDNGRQNGSHYLLTSLTLFTTHEPCVMCSMALLHSRVKEIVYLQPMVKTGACGSITCLPILKGVNHRFGILRWHEHTDEEEVKKILSLSDDLDA